MASGKHVMSSVAQSATKRGVATIDLISNVKGYRDMISDPSQNIGRGSISTVAFVVIFTLQAQYSMPSRIVSHAKQDRIAWQVASTRHLASGTVSNRRGRIEMMDLV